MDQEGSLTGVNDVVFGVVRSLLKRLLDHLTKAVKIIWVLDKLLMPKHNIHIKRFEQLLQLTLRLHKHLTHTREHLHLYIAHLFILAYQLAYSLYYVIFKLYSTRLFDHLEHRD